MTGIRRRTLRVLLFFCLAAPVASLAAPVASLAAMDNSSRVAQLEQENARLHQELRQLKRELAKEKTDEQQAGWPQVLGGIGIIFGLCGVAMMVSAKKNS